MTKHIGLGRGLSALIKDTPVSENKGAETDQGVTRVPLSSIHKSPWQPRRNFDADALSDLVKSVRERGLLQPLLVRKADGAYQLIAGERRFRAAHEAELQEVPVIVVEASDRDALELALIENLQREDLDPIEEAEGYRSLVDKFGLTQEEVSERVGKSRAAVANALRLLGLSEKVRKYISSGELNVGHAKVLLGVEIQQEQDLLAERIIKEGLSVRALEKIIANLHKPGRTTRREQSDIPASHLQHLSDQLHQRLGTSVRVTPSKTLSNGKKRRGRIEIDYYSTDDLNRLLVIMGISESL